MNKGKVVVKHRETNRPIASVCATSSAVNGLDITVSRASGDRLIVWSTPNRGVHLEPNQAIEFCENVIKLANQLKEQA